MNYRSDFWDYADDDGCGIREKLEGLLAEIVVDGTPYEKVCEREKEFSGTGGFVGTIRGGRLDNVRVIDRNFGSGSSIAFWFDRPGGGASAAYLDPDPDDADDDALGCLRSRFGRTEPEDALDAAEGQGRR